MQMGAGAPAGVAHGCQKIASLHLLARPHLDAAVVAEDRDEILAVLDDDQVAEAPPDRAAAERVLTGEGDDAVGGGIDGGLRRRREIGAGVELELPREGAAAMAERADQHELAAEGTDRRRGPHLVRMRVLERLHGAQRPVERHQAVPHAQAQTIAHGTVIPGGLVSYSFYALS